SDVVELSDADFESGLAERPGLVLEEFFAMIAKTFLDAGHKLMDATANDVPSPYEVKGFPTIYF
uniref:M57K=57 kDa nuclear matrix protein (Fragments) n=1 Tax=Gallus gallus TaxID=9031 RepID=Q9PSQ1_CHICK